MLEIMRDATDANSPSMAQWRLFGTSCPKIAVVLWEYQEILIPYQSHKGIVQSGFTPPKLLNKLVE